MSKQMLSLILALFAASPLNSFAVMGAGSGGGGDAYSQEFAKIGLDLETWVASQRNNSDFPSRITPEKFKAAVETTRVESTDDELTLNNVPKDAINYPDEGRIIFNRGRWSKLQTYREKAALVFHEYLGIMRVDDKSYQMSSWILGLAGMEVDEIDFDLIKNANVCSVAGLSLEDCDPNAARDFSKRVVAQEIRRCQFMDVNLNYCLTTSLNPTVIAALTLYAQRAYDKGLRLRDVFEEGYFPIKDDKVGYIKNWERCQLVGIAPKDCN